MMNMPPLHRFDPRKILQAAWQGDYPSSWRVFSGYKRMHNNFFLVLGIILIPPVLCILASTLFSCATNVTCDSYSGLVMIIAIAILGGLFALFIYGLKKSRRQQRQEPPPTIVVMPDGVVVSTQRQEINALAFADILYMRLRVQAHGTSSTSSTVPVLSVWLDLTYARGGHGIWVVDIEPKDSIAQCILDAFTAYRLASGSPNE